MPTSTRGTASRTLTELWTTASRVVYAQLQFLRNVGYTEDFLRSIPESKRAKLCNCYVQEYFKANAEFWAQVSTPGTRVVIRDSTAVKLIDKKLGIGIVQSQSSSVGTSTSGQITAAFLLGCCRRLNIGKPFSPRQMFDALQVPSECDVDIVADVNIPFPAMFVSIKEVVRRCQAHTMGSVSSKN